MENLYTLVGVNHIKSMMYLIMMLCKLFLIVSSDSCTLYSPEPIVFEQQGDINIAYIGNFMTVCTEGPCKGQSITPVTIQHPDIFAYAVREINMRQDLLPNVTLGFTVMDACGDSFIALSRVWTMLMNRCHNRTGSFVGVLGPRSSPQAVTVSGSLTIHRLPHIGILSSSDELSDKVRYKYFQRLVPPDQYQTEMVIDILQHFDWNFFSALYSEGSYGENAYKQLSEKIIGKRICIGHAAKLSKETSKTQVGEILSEIYKNRKNRAIVVITSRQIFAIVMKTIFAKQLHKHFVLLASDSLCSESFGRYPTPIGMLCISFSEHRLPKFTQQYIQTDPRGQHASPWLPMAWEQYLGCSWGHEENQTMSCKNMSLQIETFVQDSYDVALPRIYDGVYVFAHALHDLIQSNCPSLFLGKPDANNCVKGEQYLEYIRNVSFEGTTGHIKFDEYGDIRSGYTLKQLIADANGNEEMKVVGNWSLNNPSERRLIISNDIDFRMYDISQDFSWYFNVSAIKSVCSIPCEAREYYQYEENRCCWKCKTCRDNEFINENQTECHQCPIFTWPEPERALSCESIPVTTLQVYHSFGIAIITVGSIGAFLAFTIMVIFFINRKSKLVKACSRELTAISLMGTVIACFASFLYVMYPNDSVCLCRTVLFHLSVTIIFSPILSKTSRVYRIFNSARKAQLRPKFISSKAQITITFLQIIIQIVLLLVTCSLHPPRAEMRMPVIVEKYVEHHCSQSLWAFLLPLCFNIVILISCAALGFLTRKLPENFNEAWFIFLSVTATLLMWSLLLSTYFTAFYAYNRAAILAFCLLANAPLIIGCQNGTKVYVLLYLGEENVIIGTTVNANQVTNGAQ